MVFSEIFEKIVGTLQGGGWEGSFTHKRKREFRIDCQSAIERKRERECLPVASPAHRHIFRSRLCSLTHNSSVMVHVLLCTWSNLFHFHQYKSVGSWFS